LNLMFLGNIYPRDRIVARNDTWTNPLALTGRTKAHFVNNYSYTPGDTGIIVFVKGSLVDYEEITAAFSAAKNRHVEGKFSATATLDVETRWPASILMNETIEMIIETEAGVAMTSSMIINVTYTGRKIKL